MGPRSRSLVRALGIMVATVVKRRATSTLFVGGSDGIATRQTRSSNGRHLRNCCAGTGNFQPELAFTASTIVCSTSLQGNSDNAAGSNHVCARLAPTTTFTGVCRNMPPAMKTRASVAMEKAFREERMHFTKSCCCGNMTFGSFANTLRSTSMCSTLHLPMSRTSMLFLVSTCPHQPVQMSTHHHFKPSSLVSYHGLEHAVSTACSSAAHSSPVLLCFKQRSL
mmetsp:Transcript_111106/g.310417  ORF Transcript_111106/g.310417 Transcript_111106/m.310417 type:complete len:223 (-) Transcript_111106:963-1631(-)